MRIAYLILAHADPPQLQRLVNAANGEHAFFFIHVDKKQDIKEFSQIERGGNIQFSERRTKVNWGGFGMVHATLTLMRQALDSGTIFDYFVLMSGLDYPIKSNQFIAEYLAKHRGREFIKYINLLEAAFLEYKATRIRFHDHELMDLGGRVLRRVARLMGLGKIPALSLERRYLEGFIPHYGSQWWALTQDCVKYILRFVDENREFVNFHRFTDVPDQMFFHTIIMNSDFAKRTNRRAEYVYWVGMNHPVKEAGDTIKYVDWSLDRALPAILERDFEALKRSECLFARKFTTARSLKLIEQIDRHLLKR